jgi:hypothetical protein
MPTAATLVTLAGVPPGVKVQALLRFQINNSAVGGTEALLQSSDEASASVASVNGNIDLVAFTTTGGTSELIGIGAAMPPKLTNTSAQLCWSANVSTITAFGGTYGWVDTRGRFN